MDSQKELENIGSRIVMQTNASNGGAGSTAAYRCTESGAWSLATARP